MKFFLLFSHALTEEQKLDATTTYGITEFVSLPEALQQLFSNVPADLASLKTYARPLRKWLKANARKGDVLLIQGDFGLTYLLVRYCKKRGYSPVYATTTRQSLDEIQADGSIVTRRVFRHERFRYY